MSSRLRGLERGDRLLSAVIVQLARDYGELSEQRLRTLSRLFVEAGMAAVHAHHGSATQSAAAMRTHRHMVAKARMRLAQLSQEGGSEHFQSSAFQRIHDGLVHHWSRLRGRPNVTGYGAGFRFKDGVRTDKRCASVLVTEKMSRAELSRNK